MEATAKVSAVLQNPSGIWEDEIPFEYPTPEHIRIAILRIAAGFAQQGGLVRLSADRVELTPMHRVVSLTVTASAITIGANLGDIAAAARQAAASRKLVTG